MFFYGEFILNLQQLSSRDEQPVMKKNKKRPPFFSSVGRFWSLT